MLSIEVMAFHCRLLQRDVLLKLFPCSLASSVVFCRVVVVVVVLVVNYNIDILS